MTKELTKLLYFGVLKPKKLIVKISKGLISLVKMLRLIEQLWFVENRLHLERKRMLEPNCFLKHSKLMIYKWTLQSMNSCLNTRCWTMSKSMSFWRNIESRSTNYQRFNNRIQLQDTTVFKEELFWKLLVNQRQQVDI